VNVANNHSYDCGQAGFEETCSTLTNAKIGVIGRSGIPWITTIKGLRIGVLGFSEFEDPGLGRFSDAPLAIQKLRQHVDLLIVSVHWGIEMHSEPTDDQRKRAKEWIKSGADIVVGHHPHVWQPLELVDGKLVCYSLGDFLFDSPYGERRSTGILRVIWSKSKGATFEKVPVKIQNGFPVLAK
jgi:poly-gamma-glutamate synthesis protein (capsule biosynthesis protein)